MILNLHTQIVEQCDWNVSKDTRSVVAPDALRQQRRLARILTSSTICRNRKYGAISHRQQALAESVVHVFVHFSTRGSGRSFDRVFALAMSTDFSCAEHRLWCNLSQICLNLHWGPIGGILDHISAFLPSDMLSFNSSWWRCKYRRERPRRMVKQ